MPVRKASWKSDTQFNFGSPTFVDTEVVGAGDSAFVALESLGDQQVDVPFDVPGDYDYDGDKIEVTGGVAKLKVIAETEGQGDFPYTTPANYDYDAGKIEIVAGQAQLKDIGAGAKDVTYPFTVPGNYTYDNEKIVVDSVAKLTGVGTPYAHWHLNESSGTDAADSSGNGRDGTLINMEDSDWIPGKLNNCLTLDGVNEYVNCGDIASFERTEPFTCECWIKTSGTASRFIVAKFDGSAKRGWEFYMRSTGVLAVILQSGDGNVIQVNGDTSVNDGAWHHVVFTYDGSSVAAGVTFYIDDTPDSVDVPFDTLTDTIITTNVLQIGARDGTGYAWDGEIDEVVIYDKELTQEDVTYRFNADVGTEQAKYAIDNPTIRCDNELDEPLGIDSWDGFTETAIKSGSEVKYVLSHDSGTTWKYWSGAAWVVSDETYAQSSAASVVHTNIGSFPTGDHKMMVMGFLHSDDGNETPKLDELKIDYHVPGQYSTDDPIIKALFNVEDDPIAAWKEYAESATKPSGSEVKYMLSDNDGVTWKYWNGAAWDTSNETYAQANLASEITNGVFAQFPVINKKIRVAAFLHSETGATRPELTNVEVIYTKTVAQYPVGSFPIAMNTDFQPVATTGWKSTVETVTKPALTDIKYQYSIDSGVNWNETWLTEPELEGAVAGISVAADGTDKIRFKFQLTTDDMLVTPETDNLELTYSQTHKLIGTYTSFAYAPPGQYEGVFTEVITFDVVTPSGTSIVVKVRTVEHTLEEGFVAYASGDNIARCGYLIQFEATFTTNDANKTPHLNWCEIEFHTLIGIMRNIDVNTDFIKKMEEGDWDLSDEGGGTWIAYEKGTTTEIARFETYDENNERTRDPAKIVKRVWVPSP